MKLTVRLLCVASLAAGCAFAADGFSMVERSTDHDSGRTGTTKIFLEARRAAVNNEDGAERSGFVFLADQEIVRMIDHSGRSYREMTKADLEQIGNQVSAMMKQMEEQMKNMPPEQRAMMEKMMKGRMGRMPGTAQAEQTVYSKIGSGQAGGKACDRYEGRRGGEKVSEVCVVDFSEFGARPEDFAVFRELGEFFAKLVPNQKDSFMEIGAPDWEQRQGYPGIPVERKSFRNGKLVRTSVIETMERGAIPEEPFTVPQGYKKQQGFPGRGR